MVWNLPPVVEATVLPKKLADAHHAGWLAGVAMRLETGSVARNPYEKGTEEHLYWETGFDVGFAG